MAAATAWPAQFYGHLWHGISGGHVQLSAFRKAVGPGIGPASKARPERRDFWFAWPAGMGALLERAQAEAAAGCDVYHGIGIRSSPNDLPGSVFAVPALWKTFDLSTIPVQDVVRVLRDFPFKPSIGFLSGATLSAYWFLEEPLTGPGLASVGPANGRLREAIAWRLKLGDRAALDGFHEPLLRDAGVQDRHYEPNGLLRIAGTRDNGFSPPIEMQVACWRPEMRHRWADLARFLLDDRPSEKAPVAVAAPPPPVAPLPPPPPQPQPAARPQAAPPPPSTPPAPERRSERGSRPIEWRSLEDSSEISGFINDMWGVDRDDRPAVVRLLASAMALSRYDESSTFDILEIVGKNKRKDVVAEYGATVNEVYRQLSSGRRLDWAGLKVMVEKLPTNIRKMGGNLLKKLEKLGAGDGGGGGGGQEEAEPDFEIKGIAKFDSRPARWQVTLAVQGEKGEIDVTCETPIYLNYLQFQAAVYEQTHIMLATISQARWRREIGSFPKDQIVVKETPKEARPEGAIETALDEFLADAKENPDTGLLKNYAGYDPDSTFFRMETFKEFLREQDYRFEQRILCDHLKALGWHIKPKRFPDKVMKVWVREVKRGGMETKPEGVAATPAPEAPKP